MPDIVFTFYTLIILSDYHSINSIQPGFYTEILILKAKLNTKIFKKKIF